MLRCGGSGPAPSRQQPRLQGEPCGGAGAAPAPPPRPPPPHPAPEEGGSDGPRGTGPARPVTGPGEPARDSSRPARGHRGSARRGGGFGQRRHRPRTSAPGTRMENGPRYRAHGGARPGPLRGAEGAAPGAGPGRGVPGGTGEYRSSGCCPTRDPGCSGRSAPPGPPRQEPPALRGASPVPAHRRRPGRGRSSGPEETEAPTGGRRGDPCLARAARGAGPVPVEGAAGEPRGRFYSPARPVPLPLPQFPGAAPRAAVPVPAAGPALTQHSLFLAAGSGCCDATGARCRRPAPVPGERRGGGGPRAASGAEVGVGDARPLPTPAPRFNAEPQQRRSRGCRGCPAPVPVLVSVPV